MSVKKRFYPFNAEQTVNILSEFGPLVTMFVMNALFGITIGTWGLIVSTGIAIIAMLYVFGRPPIFPLIASTVTIVFGFLTILTGDPMWIQIKVTIFNVMFAAFLFLGLYLKRNFFKYVFEKTFHYTDEGWNRFTWSFAWFFVLTAVLNEVVRLGFEGEKMYDVLGYQLNGVNIWILFKVLFIMPLSGLYAWFLTRLMVKHRIPDTVSEDIGVSHGQAPASSGSAAYASADLPQAASAGSRPGPTS